MTSPMTPGQARVVLDAAEGTTDYTWSDAHHALETLAGMQEEWGVEVIRGGKSIGIDWCHDQGEAEDLVADKDFFPPADEFRLVRRYVTQHEVIDGE